MKRVLAVGFGGMTGALLRTGVYMTVADGLGLWLVNIAGSFLIGVAAVRLARKSAELRLLVSTGLIGSFTTFSAFSADWFHYLESSIWLGLVFAGSMTLTCIASAAAGLWIGRRGVASWSASQLVDFWAPSHAICATCWLKAGHGSQKLQPGWLTASVHWCLARLSEAAVYRLFGSRVFSEPLPHFQRWPWMPSKTSKTANGCRAAAIFLLL